MAKDDREFNPDNKEAKSDGGRICGCSLKVAGIIVAIVELLLCILAVICINFTTYFLQNIFGHWDKFLVSALKKHFPFIKVALPVGSSSIIEFRDCFGETLIRNILFFGAPYAIWFIVGIISILIILIAIFLLLYAIRKESDRLLIPHISAQIFLIGWLLIVVIVVAILLVFEAYQGIRNLLGTGNRPISDSATRWLGFQIIVFVLHLVIACLELFFLLIVWKLYKHFHAKAKAEGVTTTILGRKKRNAAGHVHPPANGDWYKPGENQGKYGGSPDAGDIYPYEAPLV